MTRKTAVLAIILALPPAALLAGEPVPASSARPTCGPCTDARRLASQPFYVPSFHLRRWWGRKFQTCGRHFIVAAKSLKAADRACRIAEDYYPKVLSELGFTPSQPWAHFGIAIHSDQKHFRRKTGMPEWSAGFTAWNQIYTYDQPDLDRLLRHELVHLVMSEGVGLAAYGPAKWLAEGLADVLAEPRKSLPEDPISPEVPAHGVFLPLSFTEMTSQSPYADADFRWKWHDQSRSVAQFIVYRCGMTGVRGILDSLSGQYGLADLDQALAENCGGRWTSMAALEAEARWKLPTVAASEPLQAAAARP